MTQGDLDKLIAYADKLVNFDLYAFIETLRLKVIEWEGKLNGN